MDNVCVLGFWKPSVQAAIDGAAERLEATGLATHDRVESSQSLDAIGVDQDCVMQHTELKAARSAVELHSGLTYLLTQGRPWSFTAAFVAGWIANWTSSLVREMRCLRGLIRCSGELAISRARCAMPSLPVQVR